VFGRYLVWGAGAIGGTVGAALKAQGLDVTFVDLAQQHVEAIRDTGHGLQISGPVIDVTVHAEAFTPAELRGQWAWILLCVKGQHTHDAAHALVGHLASDGCVVSLQNGLCEPIIAEVVGAQRTIGGFVNFSADWLGPGKILYASRGAVVLGELDGRITPRLRELHEAFTSFDDNAIMAPDIAGYLWGKLVYAALLTGQALGMRGIAECMDDPRLEQLWWRLAHETICAAAAVGVKARAFDGFDPSGFAGEFDGAAVRRALDAIANTYRATAKSHSGVWRDLAIRHRPTEVDALSGRVVEIAQAHGIGCPTLKKMVAMIHEVEAGVRPMRDENLLELARP
jgi:2-dehydropantoate 2-reductase